MKTSAKILIPFLVLGVMTGAGAMGVKSAEAHWFGFGKAKENRDSLIQRLVNRFNLNKVEVEETFQQHRDQVREEKKAQQEEHLNQLVSEGKLTEDQKKALIAKMEENRAENEANRDEFKEKTKEEWKKMKQEHREEMDQWFEEQGIGKDVLGLGKGMHRGHR